MKTYHFLGALLLTLAAVACRPDYWPDEPADTNALHNFDQIWSDFDAHYGMFEVKNINWDSLNTIYRAQLQENSGQEDLYRVVTTMLGHLNDAHVTLFPTDPALPRWSVDLHDGTSVPPPYDFEVVKTYLTELHEPSPLFQWGWLPGNVGYIRILDVVNKLKPYEKGMDQALAAFSSAKGVIVDIRGCPGGFDPNMQYIAGRFADSRNLYMTVRRRNGPEHNNFSPTEYWYVEPTGERRYTGPVVLLTSRFTQSVGETFTLAMRTLPNVTQLGDTTSGAFSDNIMRESWNGWLYSISIGDYRAADGASYEGKGIPPHIVVQNKQDDVLNGKDEALERAMQELQ